MKIRRIVLLVTLFIPASFLQAQLYWIGGVAASPNGNSVFQQVNWSGTGTIGSGLTNVNVIVGAPGTLSNGQTVSNKNSGGSGASANLNTQGHDVSITGNRLAFGSNFGIQAGANPSGPINFLALQDYDNGSSITGARLDTKFIVGFSVSVDPFSTINIYGNVTPINQSLIDLSAAGGAGSVITFVNGLPSQFGADLSTANFGSVITVNGQAAVPNVNLLITQGTGSALILTAIPESNEWWIVSLVVGLATFFRLRARARS